MSMEALINSELLIEHFTTRANELPGKLQKLVTESGMITQGNIQDETPVRTGNAQSSIRRENLGNFSVRIFPDLGIAPYVEWLIRGTEPHEIVPVNAKALYWKGADHPVKKVMHPGTAANPFFDIGIQNSRSDIDAEVELFTSWLIGESDDY